MHSSFYQELKSWTLNDLIRIIFYRCLRFSPGLFIDVEKDAADIDPIDPHEDINRVSYDFTDKVDRMLFEPVADAYADYVPDAAQRSIGNFMTICPIPMLCLMPFCRAKVKQGFSMDCVLR